MKKHVWTLGRWRVVWRIGRYRIGWEHTEGRWSVGLPIVWASGLRLSTHLIEVLEDAERG